MVRDTPRYLSLEVHQVWPTEAEALGQPRTHWRDYIAWRLKIP